MKKNLFLKELLESDFTFNKELISSNHLSGQIKSKKINLSFVSPYLLTRDLSVWVKSLAFLKKKNGTLTILVSDSAVHELITLLVADFNLQKQIFIIKNVQHIKQTSSVQHMIALDNIVDSRNFFHAINHDLFLITHFSVEKTKLNLGRYRVFSSIAGFKKIIFIFLILKNIFIHNEKK